MSKVYILIAVLLLVLACTAALAEEKRWVSSDGTTLKQAASVSSEDVAPLKVGTELSVLESGGRWIRVRSDDGRVGWVYAGRVSDAPPAAEITGGEGGLFGETMQRSEVSSASADSARSIKGSGSMVSAAKSDSSRSIRGLSPEVSQYAKQRGTPESYKKELDKILARKVSAKDLKGFLRGGKIGEYAQ